MRALFTSDNRLDADARAELNQVVSVRTGEPLPRLTADEPRGVGLGLSGFTSTAIGSGWQCEGETAGYRTLYIDLPEIDRTPATTPAGQGSTSARQPSPPVLSRKMSQNQAGFCVSFSSVFGGRPGLSRTVDSSVQLRVAPLQRSGCWALAAA